MTHECHPDLRRLALAAVVDSAASFSLLGRRFEPGAGQLLAALEHELYQRLYCGTTEPRSDQTEDPADAAAFVGALSGANRGRGTWEPGWRISGSDGAAVTAVREGVTFWVDPQQVRTASGSGAPGEACSVRIGKEFRELLFGFYVALGNQYPTDGHGGRAPLVRLYWHLTPETAIRYIREATGRLNAAGIPFQTKVVANPRQYVRRDSGVLYLRREDFRGAAPFVTEIYRAIRDGLLPDLPLFTRRLAPGLALAEDPGSDLSFGQSRCRLAAQALWQCHTQQLTDPEQRLGAIAEAFRAGGLDPAHPYLEPGSDDSYAIDLG